MPVYMLTSELAFPHPLQAEDRGLLAVGGDLSPERLLLAYSNGIFPWYSEVPAALSSSTSILQTGSIFIGTPPVYNWPNAAGTNLFRRSELKTTVSELAAMAAAAKIGFKKP